MSDKASWIDFWDPYAEEWICLMVDQYGNPILPLDPPPPMAPSAPHSIHSLLIPDEGLGLATFNAVNTSRYNQRLPITLDVPPDDYFTGPESVTVATSPLRATLIDMPDPPAQGMFWSIYGRPANTAPTYSFAQRKKLKYVGTMNIEPDVEYDIEALCNAAKIVCPGRVLVLQFQLGARGSMVRNGIWTTTQL